jgi:MFS family permease
MLFFGRVLTIAPAKLTLLIAIAIFELGSLFCAIAPSVDFLIFGRAVAGLGASGLWISIMTIIARVRFIFLFIAYTPVSKRRKITTMKQRPLLMGIFGAVFAVSSIVGPLVGGAFSGLYFPR